MSEDAHSSNNNTLPEGWTSYPNGKVVLMTVADLNTMGRLLDAEIGAEIKRIRDLSDVEVPEFHALLTGDDYSLAKEMRIEL